MVLYVLYFMFLTLLLVNCDKLEEKCNFIDSKLQPNTFKLLSKTIPPIMGGAAKGDMGKIGVIGGSVEYTGAPYFSALTALKVGADLAYVITTDSASYIIKGYSPDLIVYPYLNSKYASKIRSLLPKMDVIVIGPGLGRETETLRLIYDIIADCKNLGKPLVIDADGLYAVAKNASILKDYPCPGVVMTPNEREANKLMESVSKNDSNWYSFWGNCVSILVKGEKDSFYSNMVAYSWVATGGGSGRRVGGQGDILSGALAVFYNWALKSQLCKNDNPTIVDQTNVTENHPQPTSSAANKHSEFALSDAEHHSQLAQSVAAYAAAKVTRLCNYKAYVLCGRSMLASDMINELHSAFDSTFSLV